MGEVLYLGTRIYGPAEKLGPAKIKGKVDALGQLKQEIENKSDGEIAVVTQVVTTGSMTPEQMDAFGTQKIVVADSTATDTMLNAHLNSNPNGDAVAFASMSSVEGNIPLAATQFVLMNRGYRRANFDVMGTLLTSDHDASLLQTAKFIRGVVNLTTAHKVFPTTAAWIMNPNLRFSERTRKGVLGSVVLPDGSTTDVVNNEHWYAGLQSMLSGALIGMIVDPYLGERVNQASSPEETALKLLRREGTYTRQAQDLLPGYSPDQVRTTVDEALRDQLWFLGLVGSALIVLPTLSQEKVVKPF